MDTAPAHVSGKEDRSVKWLQNVLSIIGGSLLRGAGVKKVGSRERRPPGEGLQDDSEGGQETDGEILGDWRNIRPRSLSFCPTHFEELLDEELHSELSTRSLSSL